MSIVIIGAGEIGYSIARELSLEDRDVVLVDESPERIAVLEESGEDLSIILGSGSDPEILKKAGIDNAELLVAVANRDEINITACYIAYKIAPHTRRIARVRDIDTHLYGDIFTKQTEVINTIINPEELCAIKIANLLRYPGVDDLYMFFDEKAALIGLNIDEKSPIIGKSLIEFGKDRARKKMNSLIVTIIRESNAFVPSGKDVIEIGDLIYAVTLKDEINDAVEYFIGKQEDIKHIAIYGGSKIGYGLARMIEKEDFSLKLIEQNPLRAAFLSEKLEKTLVLKGGLLERAIFETEGIDKSDAFVAVTDDQEENIIMTFHAKSHGVKHGISLVMKQHIAPLVKKLGIDTSVIPQQIAIGKILQFIRKGDIFSVVVLNQNDIEVLEFKALQNSKLVNKHLKDVKIHLGALIMAIEDSTGKIVIPHGESVIKPGDRVLIIARKKDIPNIEKLISS